MAGIVAVADGSAASGERKDMMCFHRKELGHVRKFCPKRLGKQQVRERERGGGKALCFFCDKPGHLKSDCPERKAWLSTLTGTVKRAAAAAERDVSEGASRSTEQTCLCTVTMPSLARQT